jgi:hypothetical protein
MSHCHYLLSLLITLNIAQTETVRSTDNKCRTDHCENCRVSHLVIRCWRRRCPWYLRWEAGRWPEGLAALASRAARPVWCRPRLPRRADVPPPGPSGWTRSGRSKGMWASYRSSDRTPLRRSPARAGSSAVHPPRACAAGTGHCGLLDSVET